MTYNSEQSLIQLYAWISDTYGVEPKLLKGHRDYFGTTSCPGNNVWSKLPELRSEISLFIMYGFQPTRFALFQNYPNPFNSSTTFIMTFQNLAMLLSQFMISLAMRLLS